MEELGPPCTAALGSQRLGAGEEAPDRDVWLEKQLFCHPIAVPGSPPSLDTEGTWTPIRGQPFLRDIAMFHCLWLGPATRPGSAYPWELAHGYLPPGISLVDVFQALHGWALAPMELHLCLHPSMLPTAPPSSPELAGCSMQLPKSSSTTYSPGKV